MTRPVQQRDYIERLIERIAAAIAAILGAAAAGRLDEADRELDGAWSALGLRKSDALRLDDGTVRALLGPKAELAARLLDAQATVEEARGAQALAAALRDRSTSLQRMTPTISRPS
jgi:hypothetical protein